MASRTLKLPVSVEVHVPYVPVHYIHVCAADLKLIKCHQGKVIQTVHAFPYETTSPTVYWSPTLSVLSSEAHFLLSLIIVKCTTPVRVGN